MALAQAEHLADAEDRRIVLVFRVFAKQLGDLQVAIGPPRNPVSKGAAPVDPEFSCTVRHFILLRAPHGVRQRAGIVNGERRIGGAANERFC